MEGEIRRLRAEARRPAHGKHPSQIRITTNSVALQPRPHQPPPHPLPGEMLVFWAVHRHWDPAPQAVDPRAVEDTVIAMLVGAVQGADVPPRGRRAGGRKVRVRAR